jgi:hypothetical protein
LTSPHLGFITYGSVVRIKFMQGAQNSAWHIGSTEYLLMIMTSRVCAENLITWSIRYTFCSGLTCHRCSINGNIFPLTWNESALNS